MGGERRAARRAAGLPPPASPPISAAGCATRSRPAAARAPSSASPAVSTPPSSPPSRCAPSRSTRWACSCRATATRATPTTRASSPDASASPPRPSTSGLCTTSFSRRSPPGSRTWREDRLAAANLKPRLRMTTLYAFANRLGYRVLGTGNRSELAIGYFTKYGDGGVDLLPLGEPHQDARCATWPAHLGVPQPSSTSRRRRASGRARPTRARWG